MADGMDTLLVFACWYFKNPARMKLVFNTFCQEFL